MQENTMEKLYEKEKEFATLKQEDQRLEQEEQRLIQTCI